MVLTHKDEIQSDLQQQVIENAAATLGASNATVYLWQNYTEQGEHLHDTIQAIIPTVLYNSGCPWLEDSICCIL